MRKILHSDFHFVFIILFFILHGINEFGASLPLVNTVIYTTGFLFFSIVVYFLYVWKFKNKIKAGIFVSGLLIVFLFFGSFQDFLAANKLTAFLASMEYSVVLICVMVLVFLAWLKYKKEIAATLIRYINLLFLLLIVIELVLLPGLFLKQDNEIQLGEGTTSLTICDTCQKPPVYLVLLDGYAGNYTLQKYFQYNNSSFYDQLSAKGFYVADSSFSNYTFTPVSMASLFNMNYINVKGPYNETNAFVTRTAIKQIKWNTVVSFFAKQGYTIINYSVFDLSHAPAATRNSFWGGNLRLLTAQTLYNRAIKNLPALLAKYKISRRSNNTIADGIWEHTHHALAKTVADAKKQTGNDPHFTYLHLNIPHDPYLCDSLGNRIDINVVHHYTPQQMQDAYLQYLVYANKIVLNWVANIKAATNGKAVIMIMSDHGVRPFAHKDQLTRRVDNLNAIYLPGGNYQKWYKGISNVNQFRLLLNELFHQQLPLLPDKDF